MTEAQVKEYLENMTLEFGFSQAAFLDPKELVFTPEFRQCCEDNVCGNYNANYSCPPYCGTVEEMREKTLPYNRGLVMMTQMEVDDAYDEAAIKPIKKDHSLRSRMMFKELKEKGVIGKGLAMMAGPCSLCDQCTMPAGEPCRFPEDRTSCMSAYCLNVVELGKSAGLDISWDAGQVSFFSMYLWNDQSV